MRLRKWAWGGQEEETVLEPEFLDIRQCPEEALSSPGHGEERRGRGKAKEREREMDLLYKFLFFGWQKKKDQDIILRDNFLSLLNTDWIITNGRCHISYSDSNLWGLVLNLNII